MVSERPEQFLVGGPDQAHLVPEILHPLAQLVQAADAGLLFHGPETLRPRRYVRWSPGPINSQPSPSRGRASILPRPAARPEAASAIARSTEPSSCAARFSCSSCSRSASKLPSASIPNRSERPSSDSTRISASRKPLRLLATSR